MVKLTPREAQVLFLMVRGYGPGDIGRHLGISGSTVTVHRRNICRKMGAETPTHAVAKAVTAWLDVMTENARPA